MFLAASQPPFPGARLLCPLIFFALIAFIVWGMVHESRRKARERAALPLEKRPPRGHATLLGGFCLTAISLARIVSAKPDANYFALVGGLVGGLIGMASAARAFPKPCSWLGAVG